MLEVRLLAIIVHQHRLSKDKLETIVDNGDYIQSVQSDGTS